MRPGLPACILLISTAQALPAVECYEGSGFPEESGWERTSFCTPERWLEDGYLFQHVELCPGVDPPGGDSDWYRRSIAGFVGEERLFVEWRMQTDGDRSEIPGTCPSSLVAGGQSGVLYHCTIAADQVRLLRDVSLPIIYVDISPQFPHTYRVELYGHELYIWYIDGEVIDSGTPESPYPTSSSRITFRAKSWYLASTTKWDYIRYGTIPEDGSGDFDSDGALDLEDFYFFHECLLGPTIPAGPGCRFADMNEDGAVDMSDFLAFQGALDAPQ